MRTKIASLVVLVGVVSVVIALRFDTSREMPKPALPEPVAYQDIVERTTGIAAQPTIQNSNAVADPKPDPVVDSTEQAKPTVNINTSNLAFEPTNRRRLLESGSFPTRRHAKRHPLSWSTTI
jgi:hypothetical protein